MLELEYTPSSPLFRVRKKKGAHLEKMGFARRGEHFMYAEEALYLVESGAAGVYFSAAEKNPDIIMSLAHLYAITYVEQRISALKYAAYAQMLRAGYCVRRSEVAFNSARVSVVSGSSNSDDISHHLHHDYELSRTRKSPCLYRLLIIDDRFKFRLPSVRRLAKLAAWKEHGIDGSPTTRSPPLLIATGGDSGGGVQVVRLNLETNTTLSIIADNNVRHH